MNVPLCLPAAADYSGRHGLHALVVVRGSQTLLEEFGDGWNIERPHPLYSGTKSFWSILACAAAEDGLLELEECVCETLPAWEEAGKDRVRIRDLLSLTSGLPFGGLGAGVPTFEAAVNKPLAHSPGTTFTYSGIPLQVFGALLSTKLASRSMTPLDYLNKRIFDRIGLRVDSWRSLKDGTATLPTGAFLTTSDWAKFGALLLAKGQWNGARVVEPSSIEACWRPGEVNPRYGLGFWLYGQPEQNDFVAYASGAGGQALYILPAHDTVIVHFGQSNSYSHERFLRRLLPQNA